MTRELGVPGVALAPGDHLCGFYFGDAERDALLLPYLRSGLRDGDRCLAVVDSTEPAQVLEALGRDDDIDVAGCVASRQLQLWGSADTYLHGGSFSPAWMIEFWERQARASHDDEVGFTRIVGEMSWLARAPLDPELLVTYERWANSFAPLYPQALLCLYDLSRLGSGVLMDLLKTHTRLLLGGLVLENPHHLSGDEFAAGR